MSHVWSWPMSNHVQCTMSHIPCSKSHVQSCPMSHVLCLIMTHFHVQFHIMSYVPSYPMFNHVPCPVLDHDTSPIFHVPCHIFHVPYPVSGVSRVPKPMSLSLRHISHVPRPIHRWRKFSTVWERGKNFMKFYSEFRISMVSRSIKRLNIYKKI